MNHVPNQLGELSDGEAVELGRLLRARLIDTVSRTGGHLASSLGAVELIVAIHRVFDTGRDRLVFDVGHQCYAHKILTGRNQAMETLRTFGGIAGFPKPVESESDAFVAGHASNSVSVAIGMARARTLQHADYHVLALIGDGALSGGLAYEGLSDAGDSGEPLIVILNDNGMSITKSVGGVAEHLARQRLKPQYLRFKKGYRKVMSVLPLGGHIYHATHKIKTAIKDSLLPCSLFEDMGFTYLGPVDGHDVKYLTQLLSYAKELNGPVLLHVRTVKGKGYTPAERNPDQFHGVGRFCVETGELVHGSGESFSAVFGETLCSLAEQDGKLCAIPAAMQGGTGLNRFARQFPARFFDVGIAEGHAVAMAAGMAKQGMRPVFAVYSSFLQRSYDMLLHDVALQKLHVVLAVDRAGLVGEDGETHHGTLDPAFLDTIPSQQEAVQYLEAMAIAYPDRRIILCGHSKGGNLAVYAAAFCSFAIQNRIQRVYNHDGPGFSAETLQAAGYRSIAQRIETFVPQSSVVGMLMEHEEHYTVISSTQISLWQHDPYSWEVLGPDFVRLDALDRQSIVLDSTIKHWISELDRSQREAFTDAVFQILSNTNAASFKEMNENRMHSTALILKALNRTDKQTKKMLSDIILKLLSSAKSAIETNLENGKPTD